ncbi:MAG: hypothetical protein ACR2KJ_15285 [Jatrophihabitans sp.]
MTSPEAQPAPDSDPGSRVADRQARRASEQDAANANLIDAIQQAETAEEAARLAGVLPPNALNLPRWFGPAAGLCTVLFVPWIIYLAIQLPDRARTAHYQLMWVGFDIGMWAVLAGLAIAAIRRSTWTEPLAVCAATLLVTDAWFDIVTSDSRTELAAAVLSAALLELPAAAICWWTAHHAELIRRRAYGRLFRFAATRWREDHEAQKS